MAQGDTFLMEKSTDWTRDGYGLCAVCSHWLADSHYLWACLLLNQRTTGLNYHMLPESIGCEFTGFCKTFKLTEVGKQCGEQQSQTEEELPMPHTWIPQKSRRQHLSLYGSEALNYSPSQHPTTIVILPKHNIVWCSLISNHFEVLLLAAVIFEHYTGNKLLCLLFLSFCWCLWRFCFS